MDKVLDSQPRAIMEKEAYRFRVMGSFVIRAISNNRITTTSERTHFIMTCFMVSELNLELLSLPQGIARLAIESVQVLCFYGIDVFPDGML